MLNAPCVRRGMKKIEPLLMRMLACYQRKKPCWRLYLTADFLNVMLGMIEEEAGSGEELIDKVIDLVQRDYMMPLSNAQIASELGYHPNYINAVFLRHMGVTLHQYLLRYRIDQAMQMLNTTDMAIADIAEKSGFKYFSHFSQCFRQITGRSPGAYRGARKAI